MALTVEVKGSRGGTVGGDNPSRELMLKVFYSDDVEEVEVEVEAFVPLLFRGLPIQDYRLDDTGGGIWEASVRYGKKETKSSSGGQSQSPENKYSFSFDTTGGTQHITQSLATVDRKGPAGAGASNFPDFKGAIGVNGDRVEGVDIPIEHYTFTETHYLPIAAVTANYRRKLRILTGKTNNANWTSTTGDNFAIGEARFLGATGSIRDNKDWEVSFKFEGSENKQGIIIEGLSGVDKKGFEYLWILYQDAVVDHRHVQNPRAVYVERVSEEGNFADLLP